VENENWKNPREEKNYGRVKLYLKHMPVGELFTGRGHGCNPTANNFSILSHSTAHSNRPLLVRWNRTL
jgi:hypothetical protein